MQKLTQRELLESFGDIINKIKQVANSDTAQALGAAAKTAATTFAPELTRPLGRVAEPFKKTINAFHDNKPSTFVAQKLKTEYSSVFNTRTIKINTAVMPAPKGSNRSIVEFEADRFDDRGGVLARGKYMAIVTRGGKDSSLTMTVKDSKGITISGSGVKFDGSKFDKMIASYITSLNASSTSKSFTFTLENMATFITVNYPKNVSIILTNTGKSTLDEGLLSIMSRPAMASGLTAASINLSSKSDVKAVRDFLMTYGEG